MAFGMVGGALGAVPKNVLGPQPRIRPKPAVPDLKAGLTAFRSWRGRQKGTTPDAAPAGPKRPMPRGGPTPGAPVQENPAAPVDFTTNAPGNINAPVTELNAPRQRPNPRDFMSNFGGMGGGYDF